MAGRVASSDEKFILRQTELGPQIHYYLIARFADLGYYPSVQRFDVGRDTLMHLVALGLGVSFASESATAASFPEMVSRPIAGDAAVQRRMVAEQQQPGPSEAHQPGSDARSEMAS
jgi:hypothetical protein